MIRFLFISFLAMGLTSFANAAAPPPSFEAILVKPDGSSAKAFVIAATKASIRYREAQDSPGIEDRKLSEMARVVLLEPAEYLQALDLFQARKYQEARLAFAALKERCAAILTLPDNPGTLAAFYEMECLRKTGDLDGLAGALQKFNKDALVRGNQLRQIELYIFWDAVRVRDWPRLDRLAQDWRLQRLPGDQRAQISYCRALALEGLGRSREALDLYQSAIMADGGASGEIAGKSALAVLRIHLADPKLDRAEARAVAKLFQQSFGGGAPLPDEYGIFLKE